MIPWVQLGAARAPGAAEELRLMRRGSEFSIMSGAIELMNSRVTGSERALAELVCRRLEGRRAPRLLIGGFGMGFTLRAALENLGPAAQVVVGELVPAVIAWARGPMAHLSAACLDDPRVSVHEGDVSGLIAAGPGAYDAIVLDVDNGPEALSREENNRLYSRPGLAAALRALRPGGVLAVWSSAPSLKFRQRLGEAGFAVEEVVVRANRGRGARHVIWFATAPGS